MEHLTLSLVAVLAVIYGCQAKQCGSHYLCSNGCCGSGIFEECCTDNTDNTGYSYSFSISWGVIVAIVISVISFIAIIIGIVKCCVFCSRADTSTARTVYTAQPQQVTMVAGTQNAGFAQPPQAYPSQNNAYPMATPMTGYGNQSATPPVYPMTSQYEDPTNQQKN